MGIRFLCTLCKSTDVDYSPHTRHREVPLSKDLTSVTRWMSGLVHSSDQGRLVSVATEDPSVVHSLAS